MAFQDVLNALQLVAKRKEIINMFNQIVIYGRLTANPELRQTQNGSEVCSFTVAIDRPKTQNGTQIADFIKCNCWGKTADLVARYFSKGKPIMAVGRLQNNDYTDRNGIKHYSYVVLVNNVSFSINDNQQGQAPPQPLPPRPDSVGSMGYPPLPSENLNDGYEEILNDGQIPF